MLIDRDDLNDLLFSKFKAGDELVFEKIFRASYNRIVGFSNSFINDSDQSKSIAQGAFVNLWINRGKVESLNGIDYFLYRYAKSKCLNLIRHQKVRNKYCDEVLQHEESLLNIETLESMKFDSLEFVELEELIEKAIDGLPTRCKQVFIKSRFDEKGNKEIAEELKISLKAVEANMTRALRHMRAELSEYLPLILVQLIVLQF